MARTSIRKSLLRWPASNDVYITASQIEKNAGNPTMQLEHINAMLAFAWPQTGLFVITNS